MSSSTPYLDSTFPDPINRQAFLRFMRLLLDGGCQGAWIWLGGCSSGKTTAVEIVKELLVDHMSFMASSAKVPDQNCATQVWVLGEKDRVDSLPTISATDRILLVTNNSDHKSSFPSDNVVHFQQKFSPDGQVDIKVVAREVVKATYPPVHDPETPWITSGHKSDDKL